jgi:hypothetical protein
MTARIKPDARALRVRQGRNRRKTVRSCRAQCGAATGGGGREPRRHAAADRARTPSRRDRRPLAVRAHRIPAWNRGLHPAGATAPRRGIADGNTVDTGTGTPGARRPAHRGDAGERNATAPAGDRGHGLGGVGENGGSAPGIAPDEYPRTAVRPRRTEVGGARSLALRAVIGSGHCLQSRISHEHALDGYESRIVGRTAAAAIDSRPPTARCWARMGLRSGSYSTQRPPHSPAHGPRDGRLR